MKPKMSKPKTKTARQYKEQPAPTATHATLPGQPETVLLAVTGMSPAVLTETVWALANEPEPVIPSRIIVVTTAMGRTEIIKWLFEPMPRFSGQTPWEALRTALAASGHNLTGKLRFGATPDDIRVITAADAATGRTRELDDLRTPADNEAASDFLLEQVRGVVENPDTRLVASIAGGRKTMGALLYACMTLVGRETDRLTHVLVNDPFDTLREFFFPKQPGGHISKPDTQNSGRMLEYHPANARVDLADVPFVPLRNLFVRELGRKAGTFSRLIETCKADVRRRAAESIRLTIDSARAELDVNGTTIKLSPPEMLVLLFLARRAKQREQPYSSYKDAIDDLNSFRDEQLEATKDFNDWRHGTSLRSVWDERDLTKAVAGIREKLRWQGGDAALLAPCLPEKGRCSLDIVPSMIFIK
ncbi:MAG TPA: CRISPR-associated ring nuclease Csm6 [Verrucomicrobiota bacterium]|nr:CRISPR-associated ring nuclease Csm6 [Verrucomicrobiota bacterium]